MPRHNTALPLRKKVRLAFLILAIVIFGWLLLEFGKYVPTLWELFFQKEITLKESEDQKVNLLLLGIGGGKHDGPLLTDTIIFTSIDPKNNRVNLISIPRDFWVPDLKAKINSAYASGESKREGGGLMLTKAVVGKILGQEIDYGIRVDFNGFIKAIDMVGGVDVYVERTFDDPEYPVSGKEQDTCGYEGDEFEKRATDSSQIEAFPCRYETLRFEMGQQHMSGEQALKFVRSRHGNNGEGSDFARSKRQEKIILAFRERVFSAQTFLNPVRILGLYDTFKGMVDTDIQPTEMDDFVKLARKMEDAGMRSVVLDVGDAEGRPGLLEHPEISSEFKYQWVIVPRVGSGNFTEIHEFVDCQLKIGECLVSPTDTPTARKSRN